MGFHDTCSWEGVGVSRRTGDGELGAGRSAAGGRPGGLRHGLSWVCGEGTFSFREVLSLGVAYRKRAAGEQG